MTSTPTRLLGLSAEKHLGEQHGSAVKIIMSILSIIHVL